MKKRTRLFLVFAVGVLIAGLGTGLLASYMGLQNLSILGGNGPEELAYVPADAHMVAYADVQDLVNSELRQKVREFHPEADRSQNQFEAQTGIDVERDVDHVLAAAWVSAGNMNQGAPLVLARGRFDAVRIEGLARQHGATVENYKGKRLLVMQTHPTATSVAFVEPGLVAFGDAASVRRAIDTKAAASGAITGNDEVMRLVKDVDDGNAWAVARFDALSTNQLPKELAQQLPPINWFAASGHIDGGIRGMVRAETRDEKSAQDLRDVVRGFMALARLQAGQRAEFSELVNSLELGGEGKTVSIGFSVPAALIEQMGARSAGRQRSPADGSAPQAPPAPHRPAPPSL